MYGWSIWPDVHHWLTLTQSIAVTSTISFEQCFLKRRKTVCIRSTDPTRLSPLITWESRQSLPKKTAQEQASLSGTRTNVSPTNLHHSNLNVSSVCLRSTASITERLLRSGCEKTFKALCSITLMPVIDTVRHLVLSIPAEAPEWVTKNQTGSILHQRQLLCTLRTRIWSRYHVGCLAAGMTLTPLKGSSPDGASLGAFPVPRLHSSQLYLEFSCCSNSSGACLKTSVSISLCTVFWWSPSSSASSRSSCSSSVILQRAVCRFVIPLSCGWIINQPSPG